MNALSINLWNWSAKLDESCLPLIEKVASMGFTAVELPMTDPVLPKGLTEEIKKYGLEVSLCTALTQGRDISNFDPDIRASTEEYLLACVQCAADIGAGALCGPLYAGGGKQHFLPPEQKAAEWGLAITGLRRIADSAAEKGVVLAVEPLHRYRTSVVNTTEQALQLIGDIGRDNVQVHFDTFHANIEEIDVCAALEAVLKARKLAHFHACANNRGAPGSGHLPWERIFGLLKAYGYSGHITMETFAEGFMDAPWYPLAESRDALAMEGLAYLKRVCREPESS